MVALLSALKFVSEASCVQAVCLRELSCGYCVSYALCPFKTSQYYKCSKYI